MGIVKTSNDIRSVITRVLGRVSARLSAATLSIFIAAIPMVPSTAIAQALNADFQMCSRDGGGNWGNQIVCAFQTSIWNAINSKGFQGIFDGLYSIFLLIVGYRLIQILLKESPERWVVSFVDLAFKCVIVFVLTFGGGGGLHITMDVYNTIEETATKLVKGGNYDDTISNSGYDTILQAYRSLWNKYTDWGSKPIQGNNLATEMVCDDNNVQKYFETQINQYSDIPFQSTGRCLLEILDKLARDGSSDAVKKITLIQTDFTDKGFGGMRRSEVESLLSSASIEGGFKNRGGITAADKLNLWGYVKMYDRIASRIPLALAQASLSKSERETNTGILGVTGGIGYLTAWLKVAFFSMQDMINEFGGIFKMFTLNGMVTDLPLYAAMLILLISIAGSALLIGYAFFMMVFIPVLVIPFGMVVYNMCWISAPLEGQTRKLIDIAKNVLLPFAISPAVFLFLSRFVVAVLTTLVGAVDKISGNFPIAIILVVVAFLIGVTSMFSYKLLIKVRDWTKDFLSLNFEPLLTFAMDIANFGKELIANAIKIAAIGALGGAALGAGGGFMSRILGGGMPGAAGNMMQGQSMGAKLKNMFAPGGGTPPGGASPLAGLSSGQTSPGQRLGELGSGMGPSGGLGLTQAAPQQNQTSFGITSPSGFGQVAPQIQTAPDQSSAISSEAAARREYERLGGEAEHARLKSNVATLEAEKATLLAKMADGQQTDNTAQQKLATVDTETETAREKTAKMDSLSAAVGRRSEDLLAKKDFLIAAIAAGVSQGFSGGQFPVAKATASATTPRGDAAEMAAAISDAIVKAMAPMAESLKMLSDRLGDRATPTQTLAMPPQRPAIATATSAPSDDSGNTEALALTGDTTLPTSAPITSTAPTEPAKPKAPQTAAPVSKDYSGAEAIRQARQDAEESQASMEVEALRERKEVLEKSVKERERSPLGRFWDNQPEWVKGALGGMMSELGSDTAKALKMTPGGSDGTALMSQLSGMVGGTAQKGDSVMAKVAESLDAKAKAERRELEEVTRQIEVIETQEKAEARRRRDDKARTPIAVFEALRDEARLIETLPSTADMDAMRKKLATLRAALNDGIPGEKTVTGTEHAAETGSMREMIAQYEGRVREMLAEVEAATTASARAASKARLTEYRGYYQDRATDIANILAEDEQAMAQNTGGGAGLGDEQTSPTGKKASQPDKEEGSV